jgi:iron complex transport system substrate-binding protein
MKTKRLSSLLAALTAIAMLLAACTALSDKTYPSGSGQPADSSAYPAGYPSSANDLTPTAEIPGYLAPEATNTSSSAAVEGYPVPGEVITLTDGLDRTVTLTAPAQRVISLAASNTEILYAIGAGTLVVGRDDFSDYPAEAKSVASIGGNMGKYDLEAITNLKPDLVLVAGINTPELVKSLEDLKITVFYLGNPTDFQGMFANLVTVGKLTGKETEASQLVASLTQRYDAVVKAVAGVATQPKVYYELDATNVAKPYTAGPGNLVDTVISLAGGKNIGAGLQSAWAEISQEEIISQNPEVILLGDAAYGETPEKVAQRPGWNVLAAVTQNKVYAFDDNLISRFGPRMVDGFEAMAKLLHPEAFK